MKEVKFPMPQHPPARTRHVSPYPGVRNPYNRHPLQEELTIPETTPAAIDAASSVVPYADPSFTPVTAVASKSKFPFSLGDIKGFIDRMGGIDGIVSTVSKVREVMQSVSQIAPVVKMMADVLLPGKKKKKNDDDWTPTKRRRRRKRKRPSTNKPKQKQRRPPTSPKGPKGSKPKR